MADEQTVLSNGAKILGETFILPGASLMLDGRIGAGLVHGALGLAATALLGPVAPIGRLLVAINSYSQSVSDQSVWQLRPSSGPVREREHVRPSTKPSTS